MKTANQNQPQVTNFAAVPSQNSQASSVQKQASVQAKNS